MNNAFTQPQQKSIDPRVLCNFNRRTLDPSLKGIKNWLAASLCGLPLFLVCTANVGASPVIITSNCSNTNVSCTLDELLHGGSFSANGVNFSHWGRQTNQISNGSYVFNAVNIIVTPFGSNDSAPGSTVGFEINPMDLTSSWLGTLQGGEWGVFFAGIKSDIEVNAGSPIGATDLTVRFGVDGDLASIENLLLESKNHLFLPNSSD